MRATLSWQMWQSFCYISYAHQCSSALVSFPYLTRKGPCSPHIGGNLGAPWNFRFPGMTTVSPAEGNSELTMTGRTCLNKFPEPPPSYSNHPRCLPRGPSPEPNNTYSCSFKAVSNHFVVWKQFSSKKEFFFSITSPHTYTHVCACT